MVMPECAKCAGPAEGYRCDMCGEESAVFKENHSCGAHHWMPKCTACGQAEANCIC